jgi:DNA-binding transcriptional regulator YdaS (Cro superfamily)
MIFPMSALLKAIEHFGSQSALAKTINLAPQVINNWIRRNNVPAEHCPAIEKATGGIVRCEELRPDVDWKYLRQTFEKEAA